MSDTLAGVTFLAFGNGAPDIFSTLAAMLKSSQALALGELIGAAAFITSVVAGSMAFVRPFAAVKIPLIRDIIFLLATISFIVGIMADGHLRLWHCIVMLALYLLYVFVVAGWHLWKSHNHRAGAEEPSMPTGDGGNVVQIEDEARPLLAERDSGHPTSPQRVPIDVRMRRESQQPYTVRDWDEEGWYGPRPELVDYRFASQSLLSALHHHRTERPRRPSRRSLPYPHVHDSYTEERADRDLAANNSQGEGSSDPRIGPHSSFGSILDVLLPGLFGGSKLRTLVAILTAPICLLMKVTVPVIDHEPEPENTEASVDQKTCWHRWLLIIQIFLGPQYVLVVVARQASLNTRQIFIPSMALLGGSVLACGVVFLTSTAVERPYWARFMCIPGFVVSVCWISMIADEIVTLLRSLGVICNIPEAILGLTLFAIGNSMDDLAADISVARREHPVMALAACFGGPLLNILLGVSLSGILVFAKQSIQIHQIIPIDLHSSRALFITAGTLLLNLIVLLLAMVWTQWRMTRLLGSVLIILWLAATITNVVIEVSSG